MDTNYFYNNDNLNTIYLENLDNYVILDEEIYKNILTSIEYNYLLILFSISCFSTIIYCMKKQKNEYVLIQDANPVRGEIIEKI